MALENEGNGIPATMLVGPTGYGGYPYPIQQGNSNNGLDGNGWWVILLILLMAVGGWNNGIGNQGQNAMQPIVINDGGNRGGGYGSVQQGFDQAAVMNGIGGIQSGIQSLSTQICGNHGDLSTQLCPQMRGRWQT